MKKTSAACSFLQRHPWVAAILGFLSVYVIWALPVLPPFLNWGEWFSWAYAYGDHFVLPLFNGISFWLIAKKKAKIPRWSLLVFAAGAVFILFFEPDASEALRAQEVSSALRAYHSFFIFLEFSFILFMLCIYCFSWWAWAHAPIIASAALFLLVAVFLGFVHIGDAWMHDFGMLERIAPFCMLMAAYILLVLDHQFLIFKRILARLKPKPGS